MGLDPGGKGALVTVGGCTGCSTTELLNTIRFSQHTDVQVWREIYGIADECSEMGIPLTAILEKIWLRPTDGRGSGGKLMAHFGMLRGFLIASKIRFIEVAPVTWTKKLGRTDPKGTTLPKKKRLNQQLAQQLYPNRKVILETADAFLLAEYGRRFHQ
jgi:hypothetical protein